MSDEVEDFLEHYGVKGMKWGQRKKSDGPRGDIPISQRAKGYTDDLRRDDRAIYGKGGVKRINQRMLDGADYEKAATKEDIRKMTIGIASVAAIKLGPLAVIAAANAADRGYNKVQYETYKQRERNGKAAATKLFAESHGLTNYTAVDVAYNASQDRWE